MKKNMRAMILALTLICFVLNQALALESGGLNDLPLLDERVYTIQDFEKKVEEVKQALKSRKIKYTDFQVQIFVFTHNLCALDRTERLVADIMTKYSFGSLEEIRPKNDLTFKIAEYNGKTVAKKNPDFSKCILGSTFLIDEKDIEMAKELEDQMSQILEYAGLKDKMNGTIEMLAFTNWVKGENNLLSYKFSEMTPGLTFVNDYYGMLLRDMWDKIDYIGYYSDTKYAVDELLRVEREKVAIRLVQIYNENYEKISSGSD